MKVRGLSALIALSVIALVIAMGRHAQKSIDNDSSNVIVGQDFSDDKPKTALGKFKELLGNPPPHSQEFTERKDFNESLISKERFYTENEIQEMNEAQFTSLLKDVELKQPKLSDLKELPPGALHTTPPPVLQAGKDLGLIKEILKIHPHYEKEALGFYERCAKNKETPTPVRALCLTNLVDIKKRNGEKVNMQDYPSALVELTKMVTDL